MKAVPKLNLQIPDHTILDKIGEGGMSAVYLARQISLQRKVAIKVLKKLVTDDKSLVERFVEESKTVASLDHPHIISIYEAKMLPNGVAYFTMPYLTHGNFGEIICTNSDHLIELLCQICDGLSHAHKHEVIHRDLKPDNILFDQFGRIKIADFGIAISKNSKRQTKETQLLGSAHYMSPEQIQSREITEQSDIYSLGCIIYEKLTGDHVFQAKSDFSILMSHINNPAPDVPETLQEWKPIIDQCLAKNPKDRFKNIDAVKTALLEIKLSKRPAIEIEQKITQPKKTASTKKNRTLYMGAAFMALVVLVLAGVLINNSIQKSASEKQQLIDANKLAEQEAIAASQLEEQKAKALQLKIAEAKKRRQADEEVVNLSNALDNATINQSSIETKLEEAQQLLRRYRLTKPKGDNAADKFQAILLEQPNNQAAQQGLNQIGTLYFELIDKKIAEKDSAEALNLVQSLTEYFNEYDINRELFNDQISEFMSLTNGLVSTAVNSRRTDNEAEAYLQMANLLKPEYAFVVDLKTAYDNIPKTGKLVNDQLGHDFIYFAVNNNGAVKDFLFGSNEVTVEQFSRFAGEKFTESKCSHYDKTPFFKKTWVKPPFDQSIQHPVVCISAASAQAYAQWLSQQTGHSYRLPTTAEFKYIDQQIKPQSNCQTANLAGSEVADEKKATEQRFDCSDNHVFTAPVLGLKPSNNINNINGNVAEWVTACGNQSSCAIGNSWRSGRNEKNTVPLAENPSETYSHIGFRLVREI